MDFDAVVVGAGPAGCMAAMALAQGGHRVGLFDTRSFDKLGQSIVIEIEKDSFARLGLQYPASDQIAYKASCIRLMGPNNEPGAHMDSDRTTAIILDRFVQNLAADAKKCGVKFFGGYKATKALVDGGKVVGVEFSCGKKTETVKASLVVDASGFMAALARNLDPELGFEFIEGPTDVVVAANALHELEPNGADRAIREKRAADDEIWSRMAKNGPYSTEFFYLSRREQRAYILIGLKKEFGRDPKAMVDDFRAGEGYFANPISGSKGNIRVRRSLPRLVANGFMVVGEAACMVNPMLGSGVESGLMAGKRAGEVGISALTAGTVTTESLWPYAHWYQTGRGAGLAALDAARYVTEKMNVDQVKRLMTSGLTTGKEIELANLGKPVGLSLSALPRQITGLAKNPDLIFPIANMGRYGMQAQFHFRRYPKTYEPATYEAWRRREAEIFAPIEPR